LIIVSTETQIANIVFNETRSLDGPVIREARIDVAHAIINAAASPHRFPSWRPRERGSARARRRSIPIA